MRRRLDGEKVFSPEWRSAQVPADMGVQFCGFCPLSSRSCLGQQLCRIIAAGRAPVLVVQDLALLLTKIRTPLHEAFFVSSRATQIDNDIRPALGDVGKNRAECVKISVNIAMTASFIRCQFAIGAFSEE